jgi:hypothetical protein
MLIADSEKLLDTRLAFLSRCRRNKQVFRRYVKPLCTGIAAGRNPNYKTV